MAALLGITWTMICLVMVTEERTLKSKLLYPWGKENGDQSALEFLMVSFNNTVPIRFFKRRYSDAYLCPGGRIGFSQYAKQSRCGLDVSQTKPYGHMQDLTNWTNIALFGVTHNLGTNSSAPWNSYLDYDNTYRRWGYIDSLFKIETLWYRTTSDLSLLEKAAIDVQRNFQTCHQKFKPKELLIATWTDTHDIDFCENNDVEESICKCLLYIHYPKYGGVKTEASYQFCHCHVNIQWSDRACLCYARNHADTNTYIHQIIPMGHTWCDCMMDNDYDEDFCDCQTYNNCSGSNKREVLLSTKDIQDETNKYQMVVMSDGEQAYTMFNYFDINWIYINTFATIGWSMYYYTPLRIYAEVGFERENGPSYHHPYSASDDLYKLVNETNTGMPGRWMYKISGRKIVSPGCVKLPFD